MSQPLQRCNLVGSQLLSNTDLQLQSSQGSSSTQDSLAFSTGEPATLIVVATMASGGASLKLKTGASSAITMSSGTTDAVVPYNGTNFNTINTDATNLYVRLRTTDTGGNSAAFTNLSMLCLYGLTAGENWHSVTSGHMAVASLVRGDGSGVISLAVG